MQLAAVGLCLTPVKTPILPAGGKAVLEDAKIVNKSSNLGYLGFFTSKPLTFY